MSLMQCEVLLVLQAVLHSHVNYGVLANTNVDHTNIVKAMVGKVPCCSCDGVGIYEM